MTLGILNHGWIYEEQVHLQQAGRSLLDYYTERYRHSSRREWQTRILAGQIAIDGQPATLDTRLQAGQTLAYHRPPWVEPEVPLTVDIIFADADLVVVNKPSGLPVLPGGGFLEHTLLWQLRQRYPQDSPIPIHRLGRGTSGLMLLARSRLARAHLSAQMRDRSIRKLYRALIGPSELPQRLTLTQPIGKIPHPVLDTVYGATPQGRPARSEVQVLQRTPDSTLLEVTITTGRPHQIRIHLAAAGYPLLGDPLYVVGGQPRRSDAASQPAVPGDCGYQLHAYRLALQHPHTQQPLQFCCPPPPPLRLQGNEIESWGHDGEAI